MQIANFSSKRERAADPIPVSGLTPLTTIDYPDALSALLFLQGCPWRCEYCHNGGLIPRRGAERIRWIDVIEFLRARVNLLDAVVFSGGEPTLHADLPAAMREVKALGFRLGLHTAGIYPRRLEKLLPLIDWIGMDIKAAPADYESITGVPGSGERAWESARLVIASGVAHEFRTTLHPDLLNPEQLTALAAELRASGGESFALQACIYRHCLDESRRQASTPLPARDFLDQIGAGFRRFSLRGEFARA